MSRLALQLIAKNKKSKNPFLDLGNCGLKNYLPDELLDCVWLERLNLGIEYYDVNKEEWITSSNEKGANFFVKNELIVLEKLPNLKSLYLRSNQITEIRFLENLPNLKSLDLGYNRITDFRFLENLTNLKSLDLGYNRITDFRFLENLTNLSTLYLNANGITDIRFLENLTNLKQLDLGSNQIADISFLGNLTNLTNLDLSFNKITDISFLENLTNLSTLYLSSNQITDIRFLANLTNLSTLYLRVNQISDIRFLANLTNLTTLDLRSNKITDIGFLEKLANLNSLNPFRNQIANYQFLESLTNLTTLYLGYNKISDIRFLKRLTNLSTLDLSSNQIADIRFLANLTNLTTLDLRSNQIADIRFLANLTNLTTLDLRSNNITDIRFLANLTNLTTLDLCSNNITDIRFLERLTNLISLDLSFNKISDFRFLEKLTNLNSLNPFRNQIDDYKFLERLPNLKQLDLSANKITDIRFLESLPNLISLDLGYNKIINIQFLERLTNLTTLYLSNNQITDITPIVPFIQKGFAISLEENNFNSKINLYNNPITTPPMHILEQGSEAILRYFSAGNLKPLNECKLIFVGEGGVGKTCLMKRIVQNTFDENEKQTHGINKIAWEAIKNTNDEKVKVNLWDFGGQDIQHSLHQFFFTERVIYVLVLNPRNDDKAAYWLEQIDKLGADSEVLVVYNWKDPKDLEAAYMSSFYELRKKYSRLPEPFVLSVKTGEGVEKFREKVKNAILQNEGLVQEYPEKWFNIKQKLEENVSIGRSFINYEIYENWCNDFDYKDESDQKALLVTLDKIGSIVFFNKPILNNLQVLNPEWITTGAYAILTSKLTKDKNGHLNIADLKEIFKQEIAIFSNKEIKIKYNENQFQYIIQLMLYYDLCQENPFSKHEYLIPSAFGAKPNNNYETHKQDARNYRVQFDSPFEMLIIHRFIAKNLSKVQGKDYWQSGIFIKDNSSNTFALVETNLHSSRIDFWIKGDNIRGFWEAMRRDFQEIFSIYKKFSYQEEVLYKQDNREVYLPYQEMLDSLRDGVSTIDYHPAYRLKNINVLAVLDLFEDAKITEINIRKEMEQKGNITINTGGGDFINHGQFAVKKSKQKIINNIESSKLNEFNEIKAILLSLQEANVNNELWKDTLVECLDEFTKLEEVEEKDKPAKISSIDKTFSFLEKIKKGMDSIIPVTVIENLPKLIKLWDTFKVNF